ncbi:TetR/AcrR family transcriptional regulator [Paenibacillus harenae]|uniref:TetR/AcrR family transcriptional regulator n=1 Tax=Paenibacillus harenae TaxID=306543 RepID=UPI000412BAD4|nr:TetR/AcrR family transcriptional regulator [Paenibacillus harenae]
MFAKFLNLEPEKQDRIINAAAKEFAEKGFKNASTNEIVKAADISKGLLFHYFSNKKELYLFLFDHLMEMLMESIHSHVDWKDKDIFVRLRHIAGLKMALFLKHPEMFNFIKSVNKEDAGEVKSDIDRRIKEFKDKGYKDLFGDIDLSHFREGTDIPKTVQIILWTMEGFAYQQQEKALKSNLNEMIMADIFKEMDDYIELLKMSFYK